MGLGQWLQCSVHKQPSEGEVLPPNTGLYDPSGMLILEHSRELFSGYIIDS